MTDNVNTTTSSTLIWGWRDRLPITEIADAVSKASDGRVKISEIETRTDNYEITITSVNGDKAREVIAIERDALAVQLNQVLAERETAVSELAAIKADRDTLAHENCVLLCEKAERTTRNAALALNTNTDIGELAQVLRRVADRLEGQP